VHSGPITTEVRSITRTPANMPFAVTVAILSSREALL
jgi:hypothetical protein